MRIWNLEINSVAFNEKEIVYLSSLPSEIPDLEWVWGELDRVWFALGLNNKKHITTEQFSDFYNHPVWLMNGLFSQADPMSVGHRAAIASYIKDLDVTDVADYGGGSGGLARLIHKATPNVNIDIIEPHMNGFLINLTEETDRITLRDELREGFYDVVVAQDVLEHVLDPLELSYSMAGSIQIGGRLIFLNCFYPIIQCHLPANFYLRHIFRAVMRLMGLKYDGTIPGAEHAQIFRRTEKKITMNHVKKNYIFLKIAGMMLNGYYDIRGVTGGLLGGIWLKKGED